MNVNDVMTRNVITIKEDSTREQAARLLARHRISGLPVINKDGNVVGVVTEYDVIAKEGQSVGDIMTRGIISVTPDTDLDTASHILVYERIRRLPVLDQGKLVGIVSRSDVVRIVALRWLCPVCGEVANGERPPGHCPRCGATAIAATNEPEPPGS
jgi:CBS domain-containing protein